MRSPNVEGTMDVAVVAPALLLSILTSLSCRKGANTGWQTPSSMFMSGEAVAVATAAAVVLQQTADPHQSPPDRKKMCSLCTTVNLTRCAWPRSWVTVSGVHRVTIAIRDSRRGAQSLCKFPVFAPPGLPKSPISSPADFHSFLGAFVPGLSFLSSSCLFVILCVCYRCFLSPLLSEAQQ